MQLICKWRLKRRTERVRLITRSREKRDEDRIQPRRSPRNTEKSLRVFGKDPTWCTEENSTTDSTDDTDSETKSRRFRVAATTAPPIRSCLLTLCPSAGSVVYCPFVFPSSFVRRRTQPQRPRRDTEARREPRAKALSGKRRNGQSTTDDTDATDGKHLNPCHQSYPWSILGLAGGQIQSASVSLCGLCG